MRNIKLTYHDEDGVWWFESADLPGFSAVGNTLEEARQQAKEGLAFALGTEDFSIIENSDDSVGLAKTWSGALINNLHITNNVKELDSSIFWSPSKNTQELSGKMTKTVNALVKSSVTKDPNTNTSPSGQLRTLVEA